MLASLCGQITLHIYSLNNYIHETCGIHHIVLQQFAKEQKTMATPFLRVATPFRRVTHPFLRVTIEISEDIVECILSYDYLFTPS